MIFWMHKVFLESVLCDKHVNVLSSMNTFSAEDRAARFVCTLYADIATAMIMSMLINTEAGSKKHKRKNVVSVGVS
jgi:hypothetical protein